MPSLNKDLPVPLYHQLECILRDAIESGQFKADQQLPNETQLAEQFGVSKITVRQALHELSSLGYIRREQGRGTFVSKPKLDQGPRELLSFTEEMRRHKLDPASRVLEKIVIQADEEIAARLQMDEGDAVLQIRRLRMADGEPMGVQTAHIPAALAPELEKENLESVSLYELLLTRYGLQAVRARETHFAALADEEAAKLLGIAAGSAVFAAERVTFLPGGKPLEFVKSIMRGDRYSIVLDLVADRAPQAARYGAPVSREDAGGSEPGGSEIR